MVAGDLALAGAQRVALPGEHPVAETLRQVEQAVRVGDEGAVAAVAEACAAAVPAKSSERAPVKAMAAAAPVPART